MPSYRLEPAPIAVPGDIVAGDAAQRRRDRFLLGRLAEAGPRRELWLDGSGEQVVAILGKRGTGKSYSLGVLLEALAAGAGDSQLAHLETPRAALVLDIMDIFWTSQITLSPEGSPEIARQHALMNGHGFESRPLNIDVWLPAGFENPQIDPPRLSSLRIAPSDLDLDDWGALFEVDIFSEPRGMLIADVVSHVGTTGYTRQDGTQVAAQPGFNFAALISCLDTDGDLLASYRPDTLRSVRQRFATYAALSMFSGTPTALTAVLQSFRVSVLMLARLPDALKKVVVAVLLRRLMRERRDASFAQKRLDLQGGLPDEERTQLQKFISESVPRSWILLDEAHVLAGADEPSVARDGLVKYAKEGRNYGLSLAVATQQPSALDSRLMSQVETMIVHQLTAPRDAAVATQSMRSPMPRELRVDGTEVDFENLLRRLGQGTAVFSSGNAPMLDRLCLFNVRPRTTAHGGYEA